MTVLLSGSSALPAHAVEVDGGPSSVIDALVAALTHTLGYIRVAETSSPVIDLVVDSMDEDPDDVVIRYVSRIFQGGPRPIPLFLTSRRERYCRRGLAWENEFLFPVSHLRLDELGARMRMLAHMWGAGFPIDIVRDAVVGSFRMMMQLDADDYHHRSLLIEDLQRIAEWDGSGEAPGLRVAPGNSWQPPLSEDHAYSKLFPNAHEQIKSDMKSMLASRERRWDPTSPQTVRDLANTILRKIPSVSGRFVHALPGTRPRVLIIDDEATEIVASLKNHRVGYEKNSASLEEIFEFVAEPLTLNGDPPCPPFFHPEKWIRSRVTGGVRPGQSLTDLRCADLILLDLSLNQGQESELAGFILLEKLRQAIPDIPLVIHTGSAALGHIIQAIRNGADWYVRKDGARAYSDLASILSDIGRRPAWRKRASRLRHERLIANQASLPDALQRDELFYVWRSLANDLPAGKLHIYPFSAGLSGAVTCGVQVVEDGEASRHPLTSFVAKIDRPYVMVSERERFRHLVRPRIGNRVGRIDSDVIYAGPDVAGIAYTFSGIHQGQTGESYTAIEPLSIFLDRKLDRSEASFTAVASVFDELLNDLLRTLHQATPTGSRSTWIEPLFGESLTLRDSHELRLPPLIEIELTSFSDPVDDDTADVIPMSQGNEIHLPLCRVQKSSEQDVSVVFRHSLTGRTHRAKLTGDLARFLAKFRNLRPNRALSISGRVLRTRPAIYDDVRRDLGKDLEWLREHKYPNPFDHVESVLDVFGGVNEVVGIIHGDLNLNNILIDVDGSSPVRGALWLIDFARTRRDSLAHDFVELEVDLVTRILGASSGAADSSEIMEFLLSLGEDALYARRNFDAPSRFVSEATQFIRRSAAAARIEKQEYLATLVMYYLTVLKLNHPTATTDRRHDPSLQIRRWSLTGASAALHALKAQPEFRGLGTDDRPSVKRTQSDASASLGGGNRAAPSVWRPE